MKTRKPGIFRVLSLLLALLIVANLPISAFASEAGQENDISAAAADTVPPEMLTSNILSLLSIKQCQENFAKPLDKYTWQCYNTATK